MTSINRDTVITSDAPHDTPHEAPHHITSASTNDGMTKQN